ncbi:MAG: GntR family transcriptional regulator [Leisingera sp.]
MDTAAQPDTTPAENLSTKVYADLKMKLIVGQLHPAETLSIRTLAEEYGVSAMPVREALRQLASEDALIGAAKKAYRVPDLNPSEAANLFFIRAILEGAAAEIATEHVRSKDIKFLEKLVQDMDTAWQNQDAVQFLLVNFKFHSRIYSLTGNSALQSMIESLYARTGPWLAHGITDLVTIDSWMGDHPGIIDALRNRDAALARKLVEEDARWGVDLYRARS